MGEMVAEIDRHGRVSAVKTRGVQNDIQNLTPLS